jgi:3-oxoacyl-[acyl-carrier protein] reductase
VDEIKAAGGDAIAVGGDVAADDFPTKILDATIKYAPRSSILSPSSLRCALLFGFLFQAVWQAEPHRQQWCVRLVLTNGCIEPSVTTAGFTYDRMLHTMPDDTWDIIMKVHVRAPFRLIRAAAPLMRIKAGPGRSPENRSIINVSSTSGLHGNVGQANYAAAKSAIIGFTKTIAKEWGVFGVRANTIAFGYILTRWAILLPRTGGVQLIQSCIG